MSTLAPGIGGAPASAQLPSPEISGSYLMSGTSRDGSRYEGTLRISPLGEHLYWLEWRDTDDRYSGKGALVGDTLYAVWGSEQADCTVALLEVGTEGALEGVWFRAEKRKARPSGFRAVPKAAKDGDLSGDYSVTVDEPDAAPISLSVRALGDGYYHFRWEGGVTLDGRGRLDDTAIQVVASIPGSEGQCGKSEILVADDGSLSGHWMINDEDYRSLGVETALPAP